MLRNGQDPGRFGNLRLLSWLLCGAASGAQHQVQEDLLLQVVAPQVEADPGRQEAPRKSRRPSLAS